MDKNKYKMKKIILLAFLGLAINTHAQEKKESLEELIAAYEAALEAQKPPIPPVLSENAKKEIAEFFPVRNITLGQTSLVDLEKNNLNVIWRPEGNPNAVQLVRTELFFVDTDRDWVVEEMRIKHIPFPENWAEKGFSWKLSYNEWVALFNKLGYTINITKEPKKKEVVYTFLSAAFEAISPNKELMFTLHFANGEKGAELTSPYTLLEMDIKWIGKSVNQ